jgi:hypothetical protein
VRIKAGSPHGPPVNRFIDIRICFPRRNKKSNYKTLYNFGTVLPARDTNSPPHCKWLEVIDVHAQVARRVEDRLS